MMIRHASAFNDNHPPSYSKVFLAFADFSGLRRMSSSDFGTNSRPKIGLTALDSDSLRSFGTMEYFKASYGFKDRNFIDLNNFRTYGNLASKLVEVASC